MKKGIMVVTNKENGGFAELFIYGYIGDDFTGDCVTASEFVKELRKLEKEYTTIKVRINSGGGSVFDGIAMFNALRQSPAVTEAYIDGVAASMAMPVALACKKVYMSKHAQGMSHRVSGGGYGNAEDLKQVIKLIEELENSIAEIIAERTGLTVDAAKTKYLTDKDRWINAQQALSEKLIDGIYDGVKLNAPANASPVELMNFYNRALQVGHTIADEPGKVLVQLSEGLYMYLSEPEAGKWQARAAQVKKDEETKQGGTSEAPGGIDYSKLTPPAELLQSYEELDKQGKLAKMKEQQPDLYAFKYYRKYDKYPAGYKVEEQVQKFLLGLYVYHMSERWLRLSYDDLRYPEKVLGELEKVNPQLYAWKYFQKYDKYPKGIDIDAAAIEEYKKKEVEYLKSVPYDDLMKGDGMM
ncbi:MAG: Clp protease ClpP, partial [Taibaiella sp.]|nr:Clp protease ClpP [Taibaiella sp.]